ncbi:MAG TPA: hypothetical protein VF499_16220 [Afipia sp.]
MIFVPVRPFSEIFPIETDGQHSTNAAWRQIVERDGRSPSDPFFAIVRWLSANAKGGYREWVDISRREPAADGCQRIMGQAGFRFRDPEEGLKFREMFEQRD